MTLWLPRAALGEDLRIAGAIHGLVISERVRPRRCFGPLFTRSARGRRGSEALEFDELIGCAADLAIKALRRHAPKTPGFDAGSPLETFITIRRFIDRNLAAPKLGPEMIAASFGLSRSTLYRLFEPTGGLSAYIRDVRMRRAYEEITSPARANRRIGPAAFRARLQELQRLQPSFPRDLRHDPCRSPQNRRLRSHNSTDDPVPMLVSTLCRWICALQY